MAPSGVLVTPSGPLFPGSLPIGSTGQAAGQSTSVLVEQQLDRASAGLYLETLPLPEISRSDQLPAPPADFVTFWPHQFISSLSATFLAMCLITILTIFLPVGLQAKADPNLTPAHVKPEWYFLWLYEFLHFMPTILGILAPIVAIIGLVALPFLDRNPERAPRKRLLAVIGCIAACIAVASLTVIGYLEQ